jgi:two-component system, NarL family, response regulator DevR
MSATVLIVDDHPVVRVGIIKSLNAAGFACVGQAGSVKEAIAMIALHNPQVISVDLNLPDGNGLEIVQWVKTHSPLTIVIILSLNDELNLILAAARAGANGYISKSSGIELLVAAIESALLNPTAFTSNRALELFMREKTADLLSPREITVTSYLAGERNLSEIAAAMFISQATVKTHIASIYRKLDVHSRQSAVARAKSMGLL